MTPALSFKTVPALLVLTLCYFTVTAWNLGLQHIAGPDEPRYAVAARNMLHGGDLIVPMFNQHPHLEKPVLFHWLLVASGYVSEKLGIPLETAGFRFVPLLMGWLTVVALYLLSSRLLNPRGALIAALILITSFQFHNVSRELVIDMTLTCFLLWSWLFFHHAAERIEAHQSAFSQLLGFYLCLGFACMSKGPFLVAIFSVVPLLLYLGWTQRMALLLRAGIWWGLPLSLAMGLSWFVALHYRGIDSSSFFTTENLARFFGKKDHIHKLPFFFYIISMPEIFAPWFLLFPCAAWWTCNTLRAKKSALSVPAKLAACALGAGFVVMGLSGSKRHLYLMPLFPWVSLWLAWYIERNFLNRSEKPAGRFPELLLKASGVLLLLSAVAVAFWLPKSGGTTLESAICATTGLAGLLALFAAASALAAADYSGALFRILALALLLAFMLEAVVRPIHERTMNLSEFYAEVNVRAGGKELVIMGTNSNEAAWYVTNARGEIDEIGPRDLKPRFFDSTGTNLLLAVSYFDNRPSLKQSLLVLSPQFSRNNMSFLLAAPDPLHPPDASVFKVNAPNKKLSFFNDL